MITGATQLDRTALDSSAGIPTTAASATNLASWFQRRHVLLLGVAASLLTILPILAAHHLPLLDSPAHVARLATLRDLVITNRGSPFYRLDTFFLPNVAFDVTGLALSGMFEPEMVGRIIYGTSLLLTVWGAVVLHRALRGRWSAAPLIVAMLAFNLISVLGFLSYLLGVALILWALAARLAMDRIFLPPRVTLGAAVCVVLLFCHVAAFGIYAIMLAGISLEAIIRRRTGIRYGILCGVEVVPAIALYLAMATAAQGHPHFDHPYFAVKLVQLVKVAAAGGLFADAALVIAVFAFVALLTLCCRPRIDSRLIPGLALLGVAYFVMPQHVAGGSYADVRLPIALMFIAASAWEPRLRWSQPAACLVAAIVILFVAKQVSLAILWHSFDPVIDTVIAPLRSLPEGAVILEAECQPEVPAVRALYASRQPPIRHIASLASLDGTRFIAQAFAIKGQQPIQVLTDFAIWNELNLSFPISVCDAKGYDSILNAIRAVAASRTDPLPPLYLHLIRPPEKGILRSRSQLVAETPLTQVYNVGQP